MSHPKYIIILTDLDFMVLEALGCQGTCRRGCAGTNRFCRLDKLIRYRVGISQRPLALFYCKHDRWTRLRVEQICIYYSTYICPFDCIPLEGAPRSVKLRSLARIPSSKSDMGILSSSGYQGIRRWMLGHICHRNRKWTLQELVAADCHHPFHKNAKSITPTPHLLRVFVGVVSWVGLPF